MIFEPLKFLLVLQKQNGGQCQEHRETYKDFLLHEYKANIEETTVDHRQVGKTVHDFMICNILTEARHGKSSVSKYWFSSFVVNLKFSIFLA